jgi:prepilin-type processing-associated H-X9-DG protein
VAITECNGTEKVADSGGMGTAKADAAWLDDFWASYSFPFQTAPGGMGDLNTNYRFQSQMKKHSGQVNAIFLDAHAEFTPPRRLVWGQFFGRMDGRFSLGNEVFPWNSPVSSVRLDASEVPP